MDPPRTHYTKTLDRVNIAYQVAGDGDLDLLYVPGYLSNLELNWELPAYAAMLRRRSFLYRRESSPPCFLCS